MLDRRLSANGRSSGLRTSRISFQNCSATVALVFTSPDAHVTVDRCIAVGVNNVVATGLR
jgi:hypothetical protein